MIYGIYFSPTSNTKKIIDAMSDAIDPSAKIIDVTVSLDSSLIFEKNDFVIVGAPVYGGRIPGVAFERFLKLKGNNTPCIILATYGNRHYDNALTEMTSLLSKNGFIIYGAAAMIGRHTYGEIQVDRPNQHDIYEAIQFVNQIYKRNIPMKTKLDGESYLVAAKNHGRFQPLTASTCIQCGYCVKNCPVEAISDDCISVSDKCISCFRCIRNCPVQAKNMNVEEYVNFAIMFTEKLKERRENEFFL